MEEDVKGLVVFPVDTVVMNEFEKLKFPTSITRAILCSQRLALTKIRSLDKSAILCRSHQILHV